MSALVDRKLSDLRVVELKNELEKRGLDKTGVKALLVSRLQEALASEGHDPDAFLFKVAEYSPKKVSRRNRDDLEKQLDDEDDEEAVIDNPECFGEMIEESEYKVAEGKEHSLIVPDPDGVQPNCPLSVEDLIVLHESSGRSGDFERSGSPIVRVDQTDVADDVVAHLIGNDVSYEGGDEDDEYDVDKPLDTILSAADDNDVQEVQTAVTVLDDSGEETVNSVEVVNVSSDSQATIDETNKDDQTASETEAVKKEANEEHESEASKNANTSSTRSGTSLWISGIPPKSRANDIKEMFSKYGRVQLAKIVTCAKMPGAKCFGFVTMFTSEEADQCVKHLNQTELNGKRIMVERAKIDQLVTSKAQTATKKGDAAATATAATPTTTTPATTTTAAVVPSTTTTTTTTTTTATAATVATTATSATVATTAQSAKKSTPSSSSVGGGGGAEASAEGAAVVTENGKEKKEDATAVATKEASSKASKERKRSVSHNRDSRHRRRSRSKSRGSPRRHRSDRNDFGDGGGFRMRGGGPMRGGGMGFRRPLGNRGAYGMRRPMRGYPPRFGGGRYYDDHRDVEYERMRMREKEQMQREEMLRIEREKARLRADRERLERERLELQQQRMRIGYDGGGMQSGMGGMKRGYDDPYPPTKRMAYQTAPPGDFDNRMNQGRDRMNAGGFRRPDYGEGRDNMRRPTGGERYDYHRGGRYGGGGRAPGGSDHRSAPKMPPFGGGGGGGNMGRSDTRRMASPPASSSSSSIARRGGRPSTNWNDNGGRGAGGFGAHSGGGGTTGGGWMDNVDRGGSGGANASGGGSWGRGAGNANNAWGFGTGGGGDNQFGGERFDSYNKYSGSMNRRY